MLEIKSKSVENIESE
ncbi:hypothetical protein A2U01_0072431, partial [Trifolium medium]|nr:hypothetical protein [Trifolium medium]